MVQYERIDVSKGIDLKKSNKSKECMICHYRYFKDIGYKYEPVMVYDLDDLMILNIKGVGYRSFVFNMSKMMRSNF